MQGNVLLEGLSTIVTGFIVVYLGLIILIGAISLMRLFSVKNKKPDDGLKAPAQPAPKADPAGSEGADAEIIACIAAAVASFTQDESDKSDFIVRSIRRR